MRCSNRSKTGTRAHAERNPVELEFKGTRAGSRYILKGRPKRREILFSSSPRGGGCFQYMESQSSQIRGGGAVIVTLERIPGAVSSTRAFYSPSRSTFCDLFVCQTAPIVTTPKSGRSLEC